MMTIHGGKSKLQFTRSVSWNSPVALTLVMNEDNMLPTLPRTPRKSMFTDEERILSLHAHYKNLQEECGRLKDPVAKDGIKKLMWNVRQRLERLGGWRPPRPQEVRSSKPGARIERSLMIEVWDEEQQSPTFALRTFTAFPEVDMWYAIEEGNLLAIAMDDYGDPEMLDVEDEGMGAVYNCATVSYPEAELELTRIALRKLLDRFRDLAHNPFTYEEAVAAARVVGGVLY